MEYHPSHRAARVGQILLSGGDIMFDLIWWIVVGLIAGWITGKVMKGGGYGTLMDIVLGIVGAVIGGYLMRLVGVAGSGGMIYTIVVAVIGAVILTWVVRLVMGNKSAL
jgi:uncharacterized membrane protein YeaQ/YmgE (transglycosylase-associated protein family)